MTHHIDRIETSLFRSEVREPVKTSGWIEEPIAADSSPEEWAELRRLSASPLAGGENISGFKGFQDMIRNGNHGVIQPDLVKWGGGPDATLLRGKRCRKD